MNISFTPGPWFVNGPWHIQADTKTEFPVIIASVLPLRSGNNDERELNARLIAAAPELLQRCKSVYFLLCNIDWQGRNTEAGQKLLCELRDTLTKAEGNS